MALVGKAEGKDDWMVYTDSKQLPESLQAIPDQPLHFKVVGNGSMEYQPYWEVQVEPFTCFPLVQRESP